MVRIALNDLDPHVTHLLIALAMMGGAKRPVRASELLEYLSASRATLSRWIQRAEDLGVIRSEISGRHRYLMITKEALELLEDLMDAIRGVKWEEGIILGEVFSGMGEGAYYVSRPGYLMGFRRVLGYEPFPGTLNLRVRGGDVLTIREWRRKVRPKIIPGFEEGGRTYGDVEVLPVMLNGRIEAHALFPVRRHYGEDVLEVIHPESLRLKLNLKDGDMVSVTLRNW